MNKILIICGPTALGKTSLGISLAKEFAGEIISADSRQIYEGMDVGTGKEYSSEVKIWGYDLVKPGGAFSVSQFIEFANKKISEIQKRGCLPIIVGGTGLYIKGTVDGIATAAIPVDVLLRSELEELGADSLFKMLLGIDPKKATSMNSSDRKNPRRLIRAIEVTKYNSTHKNVGGFNQIKYDPLFIGLTADTKTLSKRILTRIKSRLESGFEDEVRRIIKLGLNRKSQSMSSLGYLQWEKYLSGRLTKAGAIKEWHLAEVNYAKRQMTWFKKENRINWFNIGESGYEKKVDKLVKKWYKDR